MWLPNQFGEQVEVIFYYNHNLQVSSPLFALMRVDVVTDEYIIEGGLDKRTSLDRI